MTLVVCPFNAGDQIVNEVSVLKNDSEKKELSGFRYTDMCASETYLYYYFITTLLISSMTDPDGKVLEKEI